MDKKLIPKLKRHLTLCSSLQFREVESSHIMLEAYNEDTGTLFLVFHNRDKNLAPEWCYQYKVNAIVYKNFLKAESKGQFFNQIIQPYVIAKSPIIKRDFTQDIEEPTNSD